MTKIIKILGSPGTGKTKKCLDIVEKELNRGVKPENLMYTTFTKAAPEEAKERIRKRGVDIDDEVLKENWNNIHSICYKMLGLSRSNVVNTKERAEFCNKLNIGFEKDVESLDSSEIGMKSEEPGNKLFSAYDWLRTRREKIDPRTDAFKEIYNQKQLWSVEKIEPHKAMVLWENYKKKYDLVDYVDMLSGALRLNIKPDADVILIDEFQDISELDYELYRLWSEDAERVYIAGDPPQSIYSFRGASPKFLLNENADKNVILDKSYRVPSKVWKEAQGVVEAMDMSYFEVEPDREGGEFGLFECDMDMSELEEEVFDSLYGDHEEHSSGVEFNGEELFGELDNALDNDQDVMALFRTRFEAVDFQDRLVMIGIPFKSMRGYKVWTPELRNLRDGIVELRDKGDTSHQKKRAVNKLLDDDIWNVPQKYVLEDAIENIKQKTQIERDWGERTLTAREYPMNTWQTRAIINNLQNGREYDDPKDVRVGTKHSAKGKEADVVLMSLDTSFKVKNNCYYTDTGTGKKIVSDSEKRVDFVAMTRAKDKLFIQESAWDRIPNHTLDALKGVGDKF